MRVWSILGAWFLVLAWVEPGQAQIFQRIFGGSRTPEKTSKAPNPADEKRRLSEIAVELAWLADPATFPYFLEAKADYSSVQVRGYVPNKQIREHALRIAQLNSGLPAVDAMKEHASLTTKPGQISAQHLQRAVGSALRESLPRTADKVKVQAHMDGKVVVWGQVASAEEKLMVSVSLRRLHGCTSVQNLTAFPGSPPPPDQGPANLAGQPPAPLPPGGPPDSISKANSDAARWPYGTLTSRNKKEESGNKAPMPLPLPKISEGPSAVAEKPASAEPPLLDEGPSFPSGLPKVRVPNISFSPVEKPLVQGPEIPGIEFRPSLKPETKLDAPKESPWLPPEGTKRPTPAPPVAEKKEPPAISVAPRPMPPTIEPKGGGAPVSIAQIKRKIQDLFPKAGDVSVEFLKGNKLRIELKAASQDLANEMANRIFTLPELERLEPELIFEIPEATNGKK